jgi:hypothetical protein
MNEYRFFTFVRRIDLLTLLIVNFEVEINSIIFGTIGKLFVNFMEPECALDLCT